MEIIDEREMKKKKKKKRQKRTRRTKAIEAIVKGSEINDFVVRLR